MSALMAPLLQSDAMVVSASSARDRTVPAASLVAMRAGSPVRAGSWPEDADDLVTPWHTHDLHQLLYAFEGIVEVETAGSHHLLPPQQAAWIPAGLRAPDHAAPRPFRCRVLRAGDGARPRRPRACARGSSTDPGDDRLRDAVAHRPTRERSDGRRILRSARAVGRRLARLGRGTTPSPHQHCPHDPRGHGAHPGAPRRCHRGRCVRRRRASRNDRCAASSRPRRA